MEPQRIAPRNRLATALACLCGTALSAATAPKPADATAELHVSVEDTAARLELDGKPVPGRSPFALEGIGAGPHHLRALAPGRAGERTVVLKPGEMRHEHLALDSLRGRLKVLSQPLGAQVFAGERYLGETPLRTSVLPCGPRRITLRSPSHLDTTLPVTLGETEETRITVALVPAGTLVTQPETPVPLVLTQGERSLSRTAERPVALAAGEWRVRTLHADWRGIDTLLVIRPGETTTLALRRNWARLSVETSPPSRVRLDGKFVGTTPLILDDLTPGSHLLSLQSPDHREATRRLELGPGQAVLVKLDLDSLEGRPRPPRPRGFEEE